jgi:hypothetical protein
LKYLFLFCLLVFITILTSCNSNYDYNTAVKNGDIVDLHGKVTNVDRLKEFIKNIESKHKDKIRITQFTTEGDPIFYNLDYNGKDIKYKYDNSKDKYGASNVKATHCKSLIQSKYETGVELKLNGCYGNNNEIGLAFKFKIQN